MVSFAEPKKGTLNHVIHPPRLVSLPLWAFLLARTLLAPSGGTATPGGGRRRQEDPIWRKATAGRCALESRGNCFGGEVVDLFFSYPEAPGFGLWKSRPLSRHPGDTWDPVSKDPKSIRSLWVVRLTVMLDRAASSVP